MLSNQDLIEQFRKHKAAVKSGLGDQYASIGKCYAAYDGDMQEYTGKVSMYDRKGAAKQVLVSFNKIKPYVSAVKGFFAQNRRKPKFEARSSSPEEQQAYSEYCNGLYENIRETANADQIETMQDGDMLICGLGFVETNLVYGDGYATRNPNGEIELMRLDPQSVGYDPTARMPNLLDARFFYFEREYNIDEALDLFAGSEETDFIYEGNKKSGEDIPGTGGGYYSNLKEIYEVSDEAKRLVKVNFYQWFDVEKYYRAPNPLKQIEDPYLAQIMAQRLVAIAEEQEYPDDPFALRAQDEVISCDAATKAKIIEAFEGVEIEWDTQNRRVYNYAIISNKKVFRTGRSICQNGFTIKAKTGDYNTTKRIWVGMVTQMIDPAVYFNKALTELMFAIASAAKGGVLYEETAVDDIAEFEASYARTDSATRVLDGAISGNKIRPKREAYSPNGVESLLQITDQSINDASGIDKAFLGSSENKLETATLQRQRIKQVTASLACYADSITLYQREHARLMLDLMRAYIENNEGETFRTMDEQTGDISYQPMELARLYDKYDVVISEAPDSATEREDRAKVLSQMGDTLIQFDPASAKTIYATAIKYLPLDMSDKVALRKALAPQDTPQIDPNYVKQLEAQLEAATGEMTQAQVALMKTQAAKNLAGIETDHAKIRGTNAEIVKKNAEAKQTIVETNLMQSGAI